MRKIIIAIIAMVLAPTLSYAGSKAEVLHWWTSGGEAKALQVLKDDFAAKGGDVVRYASCRWWWRCCYANIKS